VRSGSGLTLGATPPGYSITLDQSAPGEVRLLVSGGLDPIPLVATGAVWKYSATATDLGTAWRSNSFNDATWSSGPTMLGFGDANGLLPATLIPSNGQWIAYFRRPFQVPVPSQVQTLAGRILRDDAAVVYLNGAEVWRDPNLPGTGPINYNTPALVALGGADESSWISFPLNLSALQTGANLLAIEVHQNAVTSSDLAINFELDATLALPRDVEISIAGNTLSLPAEAGWFSLYSTTNLAPPVAWTRVTTAPVFTSNEWRVALPVATNGQCYFRLQSP